jgi:FkbM family methyltransferase
MIRLPFVLAASEHGTLIVNRYDYHVNPAVNGTFGVGLEILDTADYEAVERDAIAQLLGLRHRIFGDGAVVLDVGANIGAHTVAWSRFMGEWGRILAFEPQEWVFYALAGNLALNNCFNARAFYTAVGAENGTIGVPRLDPRVPCNAGGLELIQPYHGHFNIGVPVDRSFENLEQTRLITIDSLNLPRVDILKIDTEGMEIDVIRGARETIKFCKPMLYVEWVKINEGELRSELNDLGYKMHYSFGMNLITIHQDDPCREHVHFQEASSNEISN